MICVIALMAASAVWADEREEQRERERGRFAVGLAITSGVLINQQDGLTTTSTEVHFSNQPWIPGNPTTLVVEPSPFSRPAKGSVNTVSASVGANIELMAPALDILPGGPRFFATAEILPTFAPQNTVALEGSATKFFVPKSDPKFFQAAAITGRGTRLRAQVMTTVLAANVGAAFAFEFRDRLLRIKPSVGWIRWGVVADGKVMDAYKDDPVQQQNDVPPPNGDNIRLVTVTGKGSGFFNAVGPGLELEMELEKRGSFRPVLYLSGFTYRTVGNDTIFFQGNVGVDDTLGRAAYSADWTFRVTPWTYRAAIGFRLRWVGE